MQTGSAANLDKPPCRRGGPYVFESLDDPLVLSWMTGPRTDVGEAEFLEELSDIAGTVRNLVCGAIVTPMEGAYGNQERHPGRFAGGA